MADTLIIVPTYNEKENIERFINEIFRCAPDVSVLVVDDDSSDGTGAVADKIAARDNRVSVLHRMSGRGRGLAGIDAFKETVKRKEVLYIMEMDADFSHDPGYIPDFIREIKQNDIVIGSRFIERGRDTERNILRVFLSKIVNFFIKKYLGLKINDCSSGYRCFKRQVIASLDLDSLVSKGPAIIEETLYISNLKKYKIKEIPIAFKARYKGKTKLGLMKLLRVFMDIVKFKNRRANIVRASPSTLLGINSANREHELRTFGFRFALAMNILGAIMFYRRREHFIWFTGIGCLNVVFAILYPRALVPVKKILDFVIFSIGRLVNIVTSLVAFYLIFTPIAILLRVFGKDLLKQGIDKKATSYWIKIKKRPFSKTFYERMG